VEISHDPRFPDGIYPYASALVIDPQSPSIVYSVVDHFNAPGALVFKSMDAGGSWSSAGLGLPETSIVLAIDPQTPTTLYAGTGKGVFKSTDSAASWTPVNSGLPPFPNEPYTVVGSVAIDAKTPATVYVIVANLLGRKVFKSVNGGDTWIDASSGLPTGTYLRSVTIDPAYPSTLFTATGSGVFKSVDGGLSWTPVNSGMYATRVWDLAIDPQNSSTLYAATSNALVKTIDGGTNWSSANSGLAGGSSPLVIDPQNPSTVFAGACAGSDSGASDCGIFKSLDGGASWSASWIARDFNSNWVTALAIDPQNSNIVYATSQGFDECGQETLHKSVDGGVSWSDSLFQDLGVSAACVLALVVDPQNTANLYAAFQGGGVFKTTDEGATWSAANSGLPTNGHFSNAEALAIDPGVPSTLYTASFSGVFKSSDGGTSWNPASSGLPDWSAGQGDCCYRPRLAVDPQNSARVYLGIAIGGVASVFQSSDGGGSWTDSGLAVSGAGLWFAGLAISSEGPSIVYAGSPGQGVFAFTNAVTAGAR
jgi:photosystem II stability/assembly factor-like uncharacterized protein